MEKFIYVAPQMEIINVNVEAGFAQSNPNTEDSEWGGIA